MPLRTPGYINARSSFVHRLHQLGSHRADHTVIGMAISAIGPPSEDDIEIALRGSAPSSRPASRRAIGMVRRDTQRAIAECRKKSLSGLRQAPRSSTEPRLAMTGSAAPRPMVGNSRPLIAAGGVDHRDRLAFACGVRQRWGDENFIIGVRETKKSTPSGLDPRAVLTACRNCTSNGGYYQSCESFTISLALTDQPA